MKKRYLPLVTALAFSGFAFGALAHDSGNPSSIESAAVTPTGSVDATVTVPHPGATVMPREVKDGIHRYEKVSDGHGGWKMILKDEDNNEKVRIAPAPGTIKNDTDVHVVPAPGTTSGRRGEIEQERKKLENDSRSRVGEILKKQAERITKRFDAALERLANISSRIDSRIAKFEEKGIDTVKAKADLVIAKTKIADAKTKIDTVKATIVNILNSTDGSATSTPGNVVARKIALVKEQARIAENALKEAHKALVLAITDLKGKSERNEKNTATSTEAANN